MRHINREELALLEGVFGAKLRLRLAKTLLGWGVIWGIFGALSQRDPCEFDLFWPSLALVVLLSALVVASWPKDLDWYKKHITSHSLYLYQEECALVVEIDGQKRWFCWGGDQMNWQGDFWIITLFAKLDYALGQGKRVSLSEQENHEFRFEREQDGVIATGILTMDTSLFSIGELLEGKPMVILKEEVIPEMARLVETVSDPREILLQFMGGFTSGKLDITVAFCEVTAFAA